jgi:hypothetical protein
MIRWITFDPDYFWKQGNHPHLPRISGMCYLMQFQTFVTSVSVAGEALIQLVDDEIMKGVRYMLNHEMIPIWVQFGTQIFLDIQDVLGKKSRNRFGNSNIISLTDRRP